MYKKAAILLLALVFALGLTSCITMGGANGEHNYRLGIGVTTEESDDPETAAPSNEAGPYAIYVNGEGVEDSHFQVLTRDGELVDPEETDEALTPTHVPLIIVSQALNAAASWMESEGEVTMEGLDGEIRFEVGSDEFIVAGDIVSLDYPSTVIEGVLYVPLDFFTEVFGAFNVRVQDDTIYILVHAEDDDDTD
ncbi:MAG: copper amine oxidase N-terminal domain-containing protein [Treponema sp.]|nr:copper amine oxidase N-terminal domain-containing protein [Treponema sp.]